MASKKDNVRRKAHARFATASKLEREYMFQLKELSRHIEHLVKISIHTDMSQQELIQAQERIRKLLYSYSKTIFPWAEQVSEKLVNKIASVDEQSWAKLGKDINRNLKKELNLAPTGQTLKKIKEEQVHLITSLPLEAAKRVHELTNEGLLTGERAADIATKILQTGNVTKSRAMLIARTEVARTASALTMARAKFVGSTHYYWRTSSDGAVRESHKVMNGKIIAWNDPPEVDPGKHYHAGMFPNCRCYPEPILEGE